jgi:hypothetical protein
MDKATQQVTTTVVDLVHLHQKDENDSPFLFANPLRTYNQLDDAFTKEIRRFFQKQFQDVSQ